MSDLMRRAAPGVAVISAALATVWLFDPALRSDAADQAAGTTTQQSAGDATAGDEGSGTDPGSDGDATSGDTGSDDSASEGSAESGAAEEGSAESGAADSDPTESGPAPADPAPAAGDCGTATATTGDPAMTPWGPVRVQMELASDGTVCSVKAIAYPDSDRKSSQINARAIPILDSQAAQQGVEFDALSGATYTSEAYRESMQSILDQR